MNRNISFTPSVLIQKILKYVIPIVMKLWGLLFSVQRPCLKRTELSVFCGLFVNILYGCTHFLESVGSKPIQTIHCYCCIVYLIIDYCSVLRTIVIKNTELFFLLQINFKSYHCLQNVGSIEYVLGKL